MAVLIFASLLVGILPIQGGTAAPIALLPRGPIDIRSAENMTYANGITSGSGTPSDPYIIEGWDIDAQGRNGISLPTFNPPQPWIVIRNLAIRNATFGQLPGQGQSCCRWAVSGLYDYAVVENLTVANSQGGINLQGSKGVTIRASTFTNLTGASLGVAGARDLRLSGNELNASPEFGAPPNLGDLLTFEIGDTNTIRGLPYWFFAGKSNIEIKDRPLGGLDAFWAYNITVSNVSGGAGAIRLFNGSGFVVEGSAIGPVRVAEADGVRVDGNTVRGNNGGPGLTTALDFTDSSNVTVRSNGVDGGRLGVRLLRVSNAEVSGNRVQVVLQTPLSVSDSAEVTLADNQFGGGTTGSSIQRAYNVTAARNEFQSGRTGLRLNLVMGAELQDNTFANNYQFGLSVSEVYLAAIEGNRFADNGAAGMLFGYSLYNTTFSGNEFTNDGVHFDGLYPAMTDGLDFADNNTVDGRPIRLFRDCADERLDSLPTGQLVVVNCTGFTASNLTIAGPEYPVSFAYVGASALERTMIEGGNVSISVHTAENVRLEDVTVANCTEALEANTVLEIRVERVQVERCLVGMALTSIDGGRIALNTVDVEGWAALELANVRALTLFANNLSLPGLGIHSDDADDLGSLEIDESNTVNGRTLRFVKNCTRDDISADGAGQVIVTNCANSTIRGLLPTGSAGASLLSSRHMLVEGLDVMGAAAQALLVRNSENVVIRRINASDVGLELNYQGFSYKIGVGITIEDSANVTLEDVTAINAPSYGVQLQSVHNSTIRDSHFVAAGSAGLRLADAGDARVEGNTFEGNWRGLFASGEETELTVASNRFVGNPDGVYISNVHDVVIESNSIEGSNRSGIRVDHARAPLVRGNALEENMAGINLSFVTGGRVEENTLTGNAIGVSLQASSGAVVLRNFFFNNTVQAYDNTARNAWNGSAAEGGNYWSDYSGQDRCGGPLQDICTGPDGYGDTPRTVIYGPAGFTVLSAPGLNPSSYIARNSTDRFPLMQPVLPALPQACADCPPPPVPPGPVEMVRAALMGLFALMAISAAWIALARVRPRRPPEGGT